MAAVIDIDTTDRKTVPLYCNLIAGNALLVADPATAGRYRVEDVGEDARVLGYLQTETVKGGGVSIARLNDGLNELLRLRTVKC
jgi:hypothetical protein